MNCTGFAARAIMGAGGSIDAFSHGNRTGGNVTNLLNWTDWLWEHSSYATWYDSKESMLASGTLEKGDLIITDPRGTFDPSVTLGDKGDNQEKRHDDSARGETLQLDRLRNRRGRGDL